MKSFRLYWAFIIIPCGMLVADDTVLFDTKINQLGGITPSDAKYELQAGKILIRTGHEKPWPGITIKTKSDPWDLSRHSYLSLDVKNDGTEKVTVNCRVDNPGANGRENCVTGNATIEAGEVKTLTVRFHQTPWVLSKPLELIGMRGNPESRGKLDTSNVTGLVVFVNHPEKDHSFTVSNILSGGKVEILNSDKFIPFIDEFGQFIHSDWPGKIHSIGDLAKNRIAEMRDLVAHPEPSQWDKYGGWEGGPKLKATGFFRVEKYDGKWWLVDPNGRLFWSHGIDCVNENSATPITDRENYFAKLPDKDSPLAFYGRGSWAPHGYYKDHTPYETYDFARANFIRKYGKDWRDSFAMITHKRLRSWGMNTIGNWSDSRIYLMRQTPYVGTISFSSKVIEGSTGYWGKFFDVFDPDFRRSAQRAIKGAENRGIGDPWCIGFFIHNEIAWGDETSLSLAALQSPADQAAKIEFVNDLKKKYGSIAKLNSKWGSDYTSWDRMLQGTDAPDKDKAREDLLGFYAKIADTYFRVIRQEFKKAAPDQMYFGCRFAWVNDLAAEVAADYCDVVGYNRYAYSVEDHKLPGGLDMPIIVGEFHFGALDRGMFHTGLRPTKDQDDRALKYTEYVQGALRNPYIVGTHWFQYKDQATTGRGDGENYQIGFIDICDTPYPETIAACRQVGYNMYRYRLEK